MFNGAVHISEPLLERVSLFFPSTGNAFTGVASCHHQNIHKPSTMVAIQHLKCVCVCARRCVCARVGWGCTLHHQFEPIFDIFYGLEVSVDMAVLFGLCLWITACLLRRSAPSREMCYQDVLSLVRACVN